MEHSSAISQYQNDEIDLFELIKGLWKEKLLIIGFTVFSLIAGAIFAFSQTPVYKATLKLTQPVPAALSPLTNLTLYPQVSIQDLLTDFLTELQSTKTREAFIDQASEQLKSTLYDGQNLIDRLKSLDLLITFIKSDEKKGNTLYPWSVSLSANNPMIAATELDRLAAMASASLLKRYQEHYANARDIKLTRLNQQIELESKQLKAERINEIIRLEEAHQLQLKEVEDQLVKAKQLYLAQLNDKLRLLEEAYSTAKALVLMAN